MGRGEGGVIVLLVRAVGGHGRRGLAATRRGLDADIVSDAGAIGVLGRGAGFGGRGHGGWSLRGWETQKLVDQRGE